MSREFCRDVPGVFKRGESDLFLEILEKSEILEILKLRLKWPLTEWETGPEQKSRKNGKENGKWPPARNGQKMATEMEKWTQKWEFGLILAIFSILAAIFRPFRAGGHFPFSFPFFRDFCSGPVSHSVNGHFNRNPKKKAEGTDSWQFRVVPRASCLARA